MRKTAGILGVALGLFLLLPAQAFQGRGEAKGKAAEKAAEKTAEKAAEAELDRERERLAREGRAFGREHERIIRDWFGDPANRQGLPPGLAMRRDLPPGLQRHLERHGTLPPGLQKRLHPLPGALESKLPKLPTGVRRGVVLDDVVIIEERTSRILDIIYGVLGEGRAEPGSTGVRRTRVE